MSNFHPLEVVDRGSDKQLQVGEKLNKIIWQKMINLHINVYHLKIHHLHHKNVFDKTVFFICNIVLLIL